MTPCPRVSHVDAEPGLRVRANRRLVVRLGIAALVMFGFGYALVPIYELFCEITGLGGKTAKVAVVPEPHARVDRHRWVTVEFTAGVGRGMPWEFRPLARRVRVHPGVMQGVDFYAGNRSEQVITGQAVPSVAPTAAAKYFSKTECFCFTEQELAGHTGRVMPVRFFIDPALPEDIATVTLSYTFFETPGSAQKRSRAASDRQTPSTAAASQAALAHTPSRT